MSRRIKIPGKPPLHLLTISDNGGWEKEWLPLKGSLVANLFSEVDRRLVEEAVRGHAEPLLQVLGISTEGALRKLPSRECQNRASCTFFDPKKCGLLSSKMPWCFVPEGLGLSEEAEPLIMEVLAAWKKGMYVVVVKEGENHA